MADNTLFFGEELIDVADVTVDIEAPDLLPCYTYRIPKSFSGRLHVGARVVIPFGPHERRGYVMGVNRIPATDDMEHYLKDITDLVEDALTFNPEQASIARWISERCLTPLSQVIHCIAPTMMLSKEVVYSLLTDSGEKAELSRLPSIQRMIMERLQGEGGKMELDRLREMVGTSTFGASYVALRRNGLIQEKRVEVAPPARELHVRGVLPGDNIDLTEISPSARKALAAFHALYDPARQPVPANLVSKKAGVSSSVLKTLISKNVLRETVIHTRRMPVPIPAERTSPPTFTLGQRAASLYLRQSLLFLNRQNAVKSVDNKTDTVLLYGVTASGKTEVYLNAIANCMEMGRNAMVLVPEIALTAQVVDIFTGRFGDEVAVLHSKLSEGERHDEWKRLQRGHARIVVGARSAVFAPLENIGLIVMDEEHEPSYKQESSPRYHTRDVVTERARRNGALALFGSATPSIETYFDAKQGRISLLALPERIGNRRLPQVEVVDMREEWKQQKGMFCTRLIEEMGERLGKCQQTILFLNRRGYSNFVLCRDCGYAAKCPNCDISLALHVSDNSLRCHHCDYSVCVPSVCPDCGGKRLKGFGIGTEKVEEEALKYFPHARVERMDKDTTVRKGAHANILSRFRKGEVDILIGTQMVAKGLDFPEVTLVGVINADTAINLPDFRAAERAFQLLTQVAGRAGRGDEPGSVIVQTFNPDHYSIRHSVLQDYHAFYQEEIAYREELMYPPFRRFANMIFTDENEQAAKDRSVVLAQTLKGMIPENAEVIGPAPAPIPKINNRYRHHLLLRCEREEDVSAILRSALAQLSSAEKAGLTVDIDPINMT